MRKQRVAVQANQNGQMLLEAILITALMMGLASLGSKFLKDKRVAAQLVSEPWQKLSGMIECGVWRPCQGARGLHPQNVDRILSLSPTDP